MAQARGTQELTIQEVGQVQRHTDTLEMAQKKIYATQEAFPETTHATLEDMILKKNDDSQYHDRSRNKRNNNGQDSSRNNRSKNTRITVLDNSTMNEEDILETEAHQPTITETEEVQITKAHQKM